MKDLDTAKHILGGIMHRYRCGRSLFLSQAKYFAKVIKRFHIEDSKYVKTPLAQHFKFSISQSSSTPEELDHMKSIPYANLVGSLMYEIVCCRPNIAHAMSIVSRFMSNPDKAHREATKWVIRDIKGTVNKGLTYTASDCERNFIIGHVDMDFAVG